MALGFGTLPEEGSLATFKLTLISFFQRPGAMAVWRRWHAFKVGGQKVFNPALQWCLVCQKALLARKHVINQANEASK